MSSADFVQTKGRRYSLGGSLSTLEYHTLLRDVLDSLCHRQGNAVYCDTATRFTAYLARPPFLP